MSFYLKLSPAGGRFAATLGLRSSLPSFLLFVNELRLNLLRDMPSQTCWPVLTLAEEIPRGPSEPLNPDKELRALSAYTQGWGHPKTIPAGLRLVFAPCFSWEEQRSWVTSHPALRQTHGKGSAVLASQTRVTWQQFGCRGRPEHVRSRHTGVLFGWSGLQPASPSSGRQGHGIPTSS